MDKKTNKKKHSSFNVLSQQVQKNKTNIASTLNSTNNTKINSNTSSKKIETPLDFIKQKNKFKIHDLFDVKGTKDFLASKEDAMKEIQLEDEIINEKDTNNKKIINTICSTLDSKIGSCIKEKNSKKKKLKKDLFNSKITNNDNKNQANNEIKKTKKKDKIIKSENNSDNNSSSDNNILIIDKRTSGSDSNLFYKFIIDNANESDDKFNEKLEKIKKKIKNKKKNKNENENEKEKAIYKSCTTKKKLSNITPKKKITEIEEVTRYHSVRGVKKMNNIFAFSEKAKNLMTNDDDIELSSIGHNCNIKKSSPKKLSKINNIKVINKKEKNNNIIFGEEEKAFINGNKKDSIISILDELK